MDVLIGAAVLVALALAGVVVWMGLPKGPSLEEVKHLEVPHITDMGPEKVLLVEATGDPNRVGKNAFGLLMKAYFKLKEVPRGGPEFKPPRARWALDPNRPPEEWVGFYAMPVPESVEEVPEVKGKGGLTVELRRWEYGTVAQLLHVGRYDEEEDDIRALHRFIEKEGYEIAGLHEEEYLKGPGMLFMGNPKRYLTLIRYQVRKAVEEEPHPEGRSEPAPEGEGEGEGGAES